MKQYTLYRKYDTAREYNWNNVEDNKEEAKKWFHCPGIKLPDGRYVAMIEGDTNDFYTIQQEVDGFGNDTCTCAIFATLEGCIQYLMTNEYFKEGGLGHIIILGLTFGEYENFFE